MRLKAGPSSSSDIVRGSEFPGAKKPNHAARTAFSSGPSGTAATVDTSATPDAPGDEAGAWSAAPDGASVQPATPPISTTASPVAATRRRGVGIIQGTSHVRETARQVLIDRDRP